MSTNASTATSPKATLGEFRPKVLMVDDVDANLIALEAQLSRLGCELVRARSGQEALRAMLQHQFAVLLLDVNMADMDGYEVATLARGNASTRDIPIIFVTAMHPTETTQLKGYGAGAVDYLFKPINPEILRCKVQVFLDLALSRQRLAAEVEAHKATLSELEAFSYSVSHDLRAPLRPLAGFSQALLEEYGAQLDDTGKGYLYRIRSAAERMSQLIDDMLLLSKMSHVEVRPTPVDVAALATELLAEFKQREPQRQVELVTPPELLADLDPRLARILLENLLANAFKFTRHVASRIELGVQKKDGGPPVYFVRDNGAGFDEHAAQRLFQPFQRLHTQSEFEGTGIGLAIVQRIVTRHGGRVWAESAKDRGATFFFTLAA